MIELAPAIDTDPHPAFDVYSSGNFAEVAPERISIMSWSLVGDPVERACRGYVERLWPSATWQTGSRYVFVGYFSCRPYHNLGAYCHIARQVPGVDPRDVTASYFEDAPPPAPRRGLDASLAQRVRGLPRMASELLSLRPRLTRAEASVAQAELRAGRALARGGPIALVDALRDARAALDDAWSVHYSTTMTLIACRSLHGAVGSRVCEGWDELEPWVQVPPELPWAALYDARALDRALAQGEFLAHGFYEIADDREPWSRYRRVHAAPGEAPGAAVRRRWPGDVAWDIEPQARAVGLDRLSALVGRVMAWRELSKSLSMRALHVVRRLLPPFAALAGVADEDWPYLKIDELAAPSPDPELPELVAERRAACAQALATALPELIDFSRSAAALPAPALERDGRGVSPGSVTGVVVDRPPAEANGDGPPAILVCEAVDADIEPALGRVGGVVTARGSALSHVAILMREHGIPAVVGHPAARRLRRGQLISLDGTSGEVRVVDDG